MLQAPTATEGLQGQAFNGTDLPAVEVTVDTSLNTSLDKPTVVPGEIIVKYVDGTLATQALRPLHTRSATFAFAAATPIERASLYRADGLDQAQTLAAARAIQDRPDVEYAVPNYLRYPAIVPDDTYYHLQWHYPAIRMPEVWDEVTGTEVVVAVVDSGILYVQGVAAASHPDLEGVVLPGYDFVSDPRSAGDNDGLDPNPFDLDFQNAHGTHVAGTIAAASNNTRDVAGINWKAKILPVRVLGTGGGSLLDIMQGALWAAGGNVPGVPTNPHPAQVINMSLGGQGSCSPYEQQIFQQIFDLGAIVVVAAGNENDDANRYSPASCPGVIAVGATDAQGNRAPYSNYGPRVDIMAPGGNTQVDTNVDGYVDGVLSLTINAQSGEFSLKFSQGTSMAAPHVAGVVSLMKGLDPNLTGEEALSILRGTAVPLSPASCARSTGKDCGAGLMDAFRAIQAVGNPAGPTVGTQKVAYNPDPLDFGSSQSEITLTLTNTSAAAVSYSVTDVNWLPTNPTPFIQGLLGGDPTSGTILAGQTATMTMFLDRSLIEADGSYAFEYVFMLDGEPRSLLGRFHQGVVAQEPTGSTFVVSFLADENGQLITDANEAFVVGGAVLYDSFVPAYAFDAAPGQHLVIAWVDENANEEVDDGDYIGVYQDGVLVTETQGKAGIDVVVGRSLSTTAAGADPAALFAGIERAYGEAR